MKVDVMTGRLTGKRKDVVIVMAMDKLGSGSAGVGLGGYFVYEIINYILSYVEIYCETAVGVWRRLDWPRATAVNVVWYGGGCIWVMW